MYQINKKLEQFCFSCCSGSGGKVWGSSADRVDDLTRRHRARPQSRGGWAATTGSWASHTSSSSWRHSTSSTRRSPASCPPSSSATSSGTSASTPPRRSCRWRGEIEIKTVTTLLFCSVDCRVSKLLNYSYCTFSNPIKIYTVLFQLENWKFESF